MQAPQLNFTPKGLYIGGKWVDAAAGKTFESVNPSTREKLGDVPSADQRDVDRAVKAAKIAFAEWSRVPVRERARALERLAARINEHAQELALMDSLDSGNAICWSRRQEAKETRR